MFKAFYATFEKYFYYFKYYSYIVNIKEWKLNKSCTSNNVSGLCFMIKAFLLD